MHIRLFILIAIFSSLANSELLSQQRQPNVIVFLVDDMGWQDTEVPFHTQRTKWNDLYRTPSMRRLAEEGMMFTQAYAHQNCTPSRISMLTGMSPLQHKVTSWTFQRDRNSSEGADTNLIQPAWNMNGLLPSPGPNAVYATTLPNLLKQKGYISVHIGKAHFGAYETAGADPLNLGFDINIGGTAAGQPGSYYGRTGFTNPRRNPDPWAVPHLEKYNGRKIYLTEALTLEAIRVMDSLHTKAKPFYLNMAQYAIHTPIQPDPRFVKKYYEIGLDSIEAAYASLIEGMDKSLGDIMDFLERKGIRENTVLVFMSDNGGLTDVSRSPVWRNTYNSPLRSGKTSGYEGGIRVPMIVKWPGTVSANTRNAQPVIIEDIFPTVLDIAGITDPVTVQKIDGKSLVPLLKGGRMNERCFFWHHPHARSRGSKDIAPFSAVRKGAWKLIYLHADKLFELYNLEDDISESTDLAGRYPAKVKDLAKALEQKLKSGGCEFMVGRGERQYSLMDIFDSF